MCVSGGRNYGNIIPVDMSGQTSQVMDPPHTGTTVPSPPPSPPQYDSAHPQPVEGMSVFLAGFKDCTEEAITYLLEMEHMSQQDPVIEGLRLHLWRRQVQIDMAKAFEYMQSNGEQSMPDIGVLGGQTLDSLLTTGSVMEHDDTDQLLDALNQHNVTSDDSGLENDSSLVSEDMDSSVNDSIITSRSDTLPTITESVSSLATSCVVNTCTSTVTSSLMTSPHSHDSQEQSGENDENVSQALESDADLPSDSVTSQNLTPEAMTSHDLTSQDVLSLAYLAQNNPAIATVTKQLIELLEGDDEDESDDDLDTTTSDFDDSMDDSSLLE